MRARRLLEREHVCEHAAHAPRPRFVGQHADAAVLERDQRRDLLGQFEVVATAGRQTLHQRRRGDELERIGVRLDRLVKRGGRDEEIVDAVAISVVIERFAEFAELLRLRLREAGLARERLRRGGQIVAERRRDRPRTIAAAQMTVDQHARADLRGGVDMGDQIHVGRQVAGVMVVEVLDVHALVQQGVDRFAVGVERDVEHRERVALVRFHSLDECDVALHPGDQRGLARPGESKLMQRANAVRVAVEYIEMRHVPNNPLR
ncbi:hypothetical protein PT2222_150015 [Paraburkholderia tropica]